MNEFLCLKNAWTEIQTAALASDEEAVCYRSQSFSFYVHVEGTSNDNNNC